MAHEARIEGLTAAEAAEVENEWRQLGAVDIRRIAQANGLFTMVCTFPGSPFATADEAEVLAAAPPVAAAAPPPVSTATSLDALAGKYRAMFDACMPDPSKEHLIKAQLQRISPGEIRYRALAERIGIPWFFIAIVHSLESGSDFKLHLHNGDPLSARTTHVPQGGRKVGTRRSSGRRALRTPCA